MQMITGQPFFEEFVILTGTSSDIADVVAQVPHLALTLEGETRLDYLATAESVLLPFPGDDYPELQVHLYRTGASVPVRDMVGELYQEINALGKSVYADPNYAIGYVPIAGDPWSVGGAPWSVGGAPWSVGGAPWSVGGAPAGPEAVQAASELFWQQWSFGTQGIRIFEDEQATQRTVALTGQGMRVGIFDTSPFTETGAIPIDWMMPTELTLHVSHPFSIPVSPPGDVLDCRDHGLFVAGLVHAVAPESEIHLIRVLNEQAEGDLFTLISALNQFIGQTVRLDDAVINLSLGVHRPAATDLPADLQSQVLQVINSARADYQLLVAGDLPIMALETTIRIAWDRGAVIVAAAGNDSAGVVSPNPPEPAQIPASYPNVIGVAASNMRDWQSCYSNTGDVAAPGGDGGPDETSSCVPRHGCCYSEDCPYGLISLVSQSDSSPGYGCWVGTSFATPLVSGLAALLRENEVPSTGVAQAIIEGASPSSDPLLPNGVIDLPNTLL